MSHDSAVFTRSSQPQSSYCLPTTASGGSSVINATTVTSTTPSVYPPQQPSVYLLGTTHNSQEHFDHDSTIVVSSPHHDPCPTPSSSSANSASSSPYMLPPGAVTTHNQQLTHPPQLTRSNGSGYTYYSPLPLDHLPSPNCTPYPLPTPPLTAPIHPLRFTHTYIRIYNSLCVDKSFFFSYIRAYVQ